MNSHRFASALGLAICCLVVAPAQDDPKPDRLDAYGDPLPRGAITRIGTTRLSNQGGPTGLAFSPDGKLLASGNGSGIVRLWDTGSGKEVRLMKAPVAGGGPLAYAPDGKLLASSAGNNLVCLWEPQTGRLLREFKMGGDIRGVRSLAFAPNSQLLAASNGAGLIFLWDALTGKTLHTLKGHHEAAEGLAFTPDNKQLISTGHDGSTRIWDVAAGKELHKFAPNPLHNSSVIVPADGKYAISAGGVNSDGILRFWDLADKRQVRQIQAHTGGAECLAISRNGKLLASGGHDKFIRFWDAETTAELGNLPEQPGPVHQIALAPEGDLFAWSTGTRLRIGKITGLPKAFEFQELFPRPAHDGGIGTIRFSHDGKKLLTHGGVAILWDERTGKELHRFNKGPHNAWSGDSKVIAFADPNDNARRAIYLHDADTGKEVRRLSAPTQVMTLAFTRDRGSVIVGGSDGAVHLLEVATGKVRASMKIEGDSVWRVVPAPDGHTVAAVCDKSVRVYDLIAGTELLRVPASGQGAAFSPDGSILACRTYQDGILLWDLARGKQLQRIPGRHFDLAFTPDGQTLVAAGMDEVIRLWDVATGKELHSFTGHSGWILSVAVSPDGRTLVSGSADTTLLLWPLDRFVKGKAVQARQLAAAELQARLAKLPEGKSEAWWAALAAADAPKAYRAMWGLVGTPQDSLPILQKWLGPICATPIASLIADLDHEEFDRRETATTRLERLGRFVRPALQAALTDKLPLEPRRRIERLLALSENDLNEGPDEGLRLLRCVEVLEHIGSAEARTLLEQVAKASPAPEPADQARAALARLKLAAP
jgi:WD40 repeat protein